MTVLQMEIIIRTIKVGRHHGNIVRTILQIEALTHLQTRNLGNGIRFVRIFQRRSQQSVLFHWLCDITGIDTGTAQKKQLLYIMAKTLPYHILLNLKVLIDKISTILQISHNSTDMRSGKDNSIRQFFIKELFYGHTIKKVQLFMRTSYTICVTTTLQIIPDSRTHQAMVSCYIDFRIFIHSYPSSLFISSFM